MRNCAALKSGRGLAGWLAQWATREPERPFLLWNGAELSYASANDLVTAGAARLAELDRTHGKTGRVVIFADNCPAAVLTWLAAQAAGLVPVTLNRAQRGDVLADAVSRSRPSVIVADRDGIEPITALNAHGNTTLITIGADRIDELGILAGRRTDGLAVPQPVQLSQTSTIMFSSGTTGKSKGVLIPHGMFEAGTQRLQEAWNVTPDDVIHCWAPWFHVAAQVNVLALALRSGSCVALFTGFSVSKFWQQIRDVDATIFGGFVSVLEMLYAQAPSELDTAHSLRFGIAGHIPADLTDAFETRFGVRMLDAYGMSEAEPLTIPPLEPKMPAGSCGPASPDFEIQIQDERGTVCPPGAEGQIVFRPLREHITMTGYLDDPQRTVGAWRNGWFLTGDLGKMDTHGLLYFRDRMSEFIRVRGENVSPQEVESVLMTHQAVAEAGLIGVASELGEHDVLALIVLRSELSADELRAWASGRMAKFMIPRHIEFVDHLPRTPTSKVQRSELQNVAREARVNRTG